MGDEARLGQAERNAERDEHFLRRCFDVARRSLAHGNHPFRAILVDSSRKVLIESESGYMPAHDGTPHAERLLATEACRSLGREELASATLYSSAEPCAMCAGAMYCADVGRLVYGLSEQRLRGITGNHPDNPTFDLPCRDAFKRGQRATDVVGPLLEDEEAALHEGVWTK
jgi:tRNA(Arg) A34 adenosine deaminase TadA